MHKYLGRPSKLASVALAAAALVVTGGSVAQAYPPVQGNSSGGCTPASQTAEIPNGFSSVTCTFTFLDASNQPAAGYAFSATASGSATQGGTSTVTDSNGQATVVLTLPACSAVVTNDTTTVTGTASDVSVPATLTRSCTPTSSTMSTTNCALTGPGAANGDVDTWTCGFTAGPAGRTYAISYTLTKAGANNGVCATSYPALTAAPTSVSGGSPFNPQVQTKWAGTGNNGAKCGFTLTAAVNDATALASSATTLQAADR